MGAVPWSPDGSDNAVNIGVGMETPAEMVPRSAGEVLMENNVVMTYLRRADFEHWVSVTCPGCQYLRTGRGRQQAHSETSRRRIEALLNGGSCGSTRRAAAGERINRALADAVERLPTKDPGMRDMLKRPSIVCLIQSQGPNTGTGDVTRKVRTSKQQR